MLPHAAPIQVGTATDWTAVSSADSGTCGLRGSGELWCWGTGPQLGLGDSAPHRIPERVGARAGATSVETGDGSGCTTCSGVTCAAPADGVLQCWGESEFGEIGGTSATSTLPRDVTGCM